jgi:hypothetical protein
MNHKEQYIEPLIRLIETNEDKSWLPDFLGLRNGGRLPGGGAGSLNDWAPVYTDKTISSWYSTLYQILRYLFDNNLSADQVDSFRALKFRNNIRVIRCLNCNKSYQHPWIFESYVALEFYHKNFISLANNHSLLKLFIPELTYGSEKTYEYRIWLTEQYEMNNIKIYDFVVEKYVCPHCGTGHSETVHDLYLIKKDGTDQKVFQRQKQNANWDDFEKLPADTPSGVL